jgi:hypothetical protein
MGTGQSVWPITIEKEPNAIGAAQLSVRQAQLPARSELMSGSGRLLHIYGAEGMPHDSSSAR